MDKLDEIRALDADCVISGGHLLPSSIDGGDDDPWEDRRYLLRLLTTAAAKLADVQDAATQYRGSVRARDDEAMTYWTNEIVRRALGGPEPNEHS